MLVVLHNLCRRQLMETILKVLMYLVGQFQPGAPAYTGKPTDAQLDALVELGKFVHQKYPIERTIGHRDVATMYPMNEAEYATACPGDNLYDLLPHLKDKMT